MYLLDFKVNTSMRLFEFKNNDFGIIEPLEVDNEEIVSMIEANCSDYLKVMKATGCYLSRYAPTRLPAFFGTSPLKRKPKDSL